MHSFTSYQPLVSFQIAGTVVPASGIVVVVGPNSSGKSLLLKDIEGMVRNGNNHKPLVITHVDQRSPSNLDGILEEIVKEQLGQLVDNQPEQMDWTFTFAGQVGKSNHRLGINDLKRTWEAGQRGDPKAKYEVHTMLSPCLLTVLDIEARRIACNHVSRIEVGHPCASDIHALFKNRPVQERLERIAEEVLDMSVWLEYISSSHFKLQIAPPENKPSLAIRHDPVAAGNYRLLIDEGDGYKSFVGMVISLLLGKRPLTLIDEPELWLHPPQAYEIGRLIGQEFKASNASVFIATHSSHLVRGLLDTGAQSVTILRMRRHHEAGRHPFSANVVASSQLNSLLQKPITATESVIDGFFTKGVIVAESEGDRLVYQNAGVGIKGFLRDIHFVTTGGNEAIPETAQVYMALGQSTAAIVDLDTLINLPVAEKLLSVFVSDVDKRNELTRLAREIAEDNEKLPPSEAVASIATDIQDVAKRLGGETSWGIDLDRQTVSGLDKIIERVKRTRRMKRGGIGAYLAHPDIQDKIRMAVDQCAEYGLFFVPVGELEHWLDGKVAESKRKKSKWATAAAQYLKSVATPPDEDVWQFMKSITKYLLRPSTRLPA